MMTELPRLGVGSVILEAPLRLCPIDTALGLTALFEERTWTGAFAATRAAEMVMEAIVVVVVVCLCTEKWSGKNASRGALRVSCNWTHASTTLCG